MELYYARDIEGSIVRLDEEESGHCIRVMRHRSGDLINVIDGEGCMMECRIQDDAPKGAQAVIETVHKGWGAHPYRLTMAVCPTKNMDRYEWFVEKATEIGVDIIAPVIGDRSERKVVKTERLERLVLSAAKQSLKGAIPAILQPQSVKEYLNQAPEDALKLICYCFEGETRRIGVMEELAGRSGREVCILIGPEGDFSPEEVEIALNKGWKPVHLGDSRLRTETAAVVATTSVYISCMNQ